MRWLRYVWMLVLALGLGGTAHAQLVPVPALSRHVTDQAGMLSEEQRAKLETVLTDYESKTGSQIAVLLVKSTAPEQIEQYSIRVSDAWKLGRKGVDDGVLLLVAPDNPPALRRLRIEAGRGVQGVLTDAQSKRILQDVIAPHFQQKQFYDGLVAGVGAIATLLNAEKFPAPPQQQQAGELEENNILVPLLLFGAFLVFSLFRPRRGRLGRGGWSSGATGFIIGSMLGGGGGGGGGGSSGGGFSGGGGSFDGGGASGDW
ncbi:TPM domain-containing protein [Massilia sp. DJPM01]|uniref:TPM domain-containing protein n=1 Tax=Massilia sp. DJPM01 TaxID=3024404 RepID=UPI00259FD025|nr:TPM domain-containing protein [Massilia sp. DJPM01]MDM5179805.1 TPM domain-containing protein [Massilia sp. DJPM01]